jgi:chemotaxis signal transduction protein
MSMSEHQALPFVSLSRSQAKVIEQLSDQEFWRYAAEVANPGHPLPDFAHEYLICRLGTRRCMFPLATLREVVPASQHHATLPDVPGWMTGLAAWRGEIFAEIDLEAYLWKDSDPQERVLEDGCVQRQVPLMLVVQGQGITLGLLVTSISTVVSFDEKYTVPLELAPDWCAALCPAAVRGIYDDVLVLNIWAIFDHIVQQIKEQSLP